jgi:eukaryotic-like serine/threonine-protein kinase
VQCSLESLKVILFPEEKPVKRNYTPFAACILVCSLVIVGLLGCGGGDQSPATPPLRLTLNWPARSRDVNAPASALSVTVKLSGASPTGRDFLWIINRGAAAEAFTQTYTSSEPVQSGTYPLLLSFHAQAEGAGAVVGTASANVTIVADGSGIGTIAVTGTIASVSVAANQTLQVGESKDLIASVRDAAGNLLSVTPGSFQFAVASGADKLTLTPAGKATGIAAGTATVTAAVDGKISPAQTITIGNPLGLARSPWPRFQADERNTGNAANTSRASHRAATGVIAWQVATGGDIVSSPVIGSDGTIYIGGEDRTLYALDGTTGTQRWSHQGPSGFQATPALAQDGTLYAGAISGPLVGLDSATGTVRMGENSPNLGVSTHVAIGAQGTVYYTDTVGRVHAVNPTTGADIWSVQFNDVGSSAAALTPDGTLYVGAVGAQSPTGPVGDHKLHALDAATGVQKWEFEPGNSIYAAPTVGDDGTVYLASWDKKVYALDGSTGAKKWEFETVSLITGSVALGSNGRIYVGAYERRLYALNAQTGTVQWTFDTAGRILASPVLDREGNLYLGTEDGTFYALNAETGAVKWTLDLGGRIVGSAAIGADGTLYIGAGNRVIAIQ